jgi:hypothetical protein
MVREFRAHELIPNAVSLRPHMAENWNFFMRTPLHELVGQTPTGTARPDRHDFPPRPNHRGVTYILTAAVGISAEVGALVSAVPSLLPHTVSICVAILIVITILNLRGVREAGIAFRGSYLSVCWYAPHNDHRRRLPCSPQPRASRPGGSASASASNDGSSQLLAPAESFRQRLHGSKRDTRSFQN